MVNQGNDNYALTLEEKPLPSDSNTIDTKGATTNDLEKNVDRDDYIYVCRKYIFDKINQNPILRKLIFAVFGHAIVIGYLAMAVIHWQNTGSKPLEWGNGLGLLCVILCAVYWSIIYYKLVKPCYNCWNGTGLGKLNHLVSMFSCFGTTAFYTLPPILFAVFLIYDTSNDRRRLISLAGMASIIILGYIFSKYPSRINWTIIYKGIFVQIIMGLFTIRWEIGRNIFLCVGNRIEQFLAYGYVGAAFTYSDNLVYTQAVFAFKCLSILFFASFVIEVLFYYQILQAMFQKLGWFLQKTMGTTSVESVSCCVSVFFGLNEAMLVVKSYLKNLTMSELQAVLLGQLSTVAGTEFAAYASFGVNPGYLVTASLMSAPAALSLSKLLYPETEISKSKAETLDIDEDYKNKHTSAIDAGCSGAFAAVNIVSGMIASLIAFISLLAFGNAVVCYLAELVGYQDVTIETILAKALIPVAYLIGIDPDQCELVGELIATKAIINEFVAYQKLGIFKKKNLLSKKSEAIATYALCSFSNPGSVASLLAMVSTVCKAQLKNVTKLAFTAYIGGIVTCFLTASIAGLLMPMDPTSEFMNPANQTSILST